MRFVNVFDLDCTLIDSSHRINASGKIEDGVDIDFWVDNASLENIMKDKLLPLVEVFREFKKTGFTNIAVTAREMTNGDYEYLKKHDLHFDMILHRGDSKELDHVLKEKKLDTLFKDTDLAPFLAFDDKQENLDIFKKFGFTCIDALAINKLMSGVEVPCSHQYHQSEFFGD